MKLGGLAFVTVAAVPAGALEGANADARLEHFQNELPSFSSLLDATDMQNINSSEAARKVLDAAFRSAFAGRTDATFEPLFQVRYSDTTQMLTVGGSAIPRGLMPSGRDLQPICLFSPNRQLNLADRERALFDLAVTRKGVSYQQATRLHNLGFNPLDFDAYRELIRFLPRYHESII